MVPLVASVGLVAFVYDVRLLLSENYLEMVE